MLPLRMQSLPLLPLLLSPPHVRMLAAPKRGSVVDSYRTVSVVCQRCDEVLFRYKKKNGLQSQLVKCYIERIVGDPHGLLDNRDDGSTELLCPGCQSAFARDALIHGRPALKMVGGKVRMRKKCSGRLFDVGSSIVVRMCAISKYPEFSY